MRPTVRLADTRTPDGGELALFSHDGHFSIRVNGQELMHSRQHESELELARLGCAHLVGRKAPRVLVGGLGMGYTLRQALDMLGPKAEVVVGELLPAVVDWNREHIGELNGHPLADDRVDVRTGDVVDLIRRSPDAFDAILLDIDNGPSAMTDSGNQRLYGGKGMQACRGALREGGCLAVWSAEPSREFENLLTNLGLFVRRYRAPAYLGGKAKSRFIWVASAGEANLPPGGGAPKPPSTSGGWRDRDRDRDRKPRR